MVEELSMCGKYVCNLYARDTKFFSATTTRYSVLGKWLYTVQSGSRVQKQRVFFFMRNVIKM